MRKIKKALSMINNGTPVNMACSLCTLFEDQFKRQLKIRFNATLDRALLAYAKSESMESVPFSDADFTPVAQDDERFDVWRLAVKFLLNEQNIKDSELIIGHIDKKFAVLFVDNNQVYY